MSPRTRKHHSEQSLMQEGKLEDVFVHFGTRSNAAGGRLVGLEWRKKTSVEGTKVCKGANCHKEEKKSPRNII